METRFLFVPIFITQIISQADGSPPCQVNICCQEREGMHCPAGSVLHVTNLRCGSSSCPWNVHYVVYPVCEGQRDCFSSGLRAMALQKTCEEQDNITAEFLCIQKSVIDTTCDGDVRVQNSRFGVLQSPGFPNNEEGNPNGCFWTIPNGKTSSVNVTVHLAYTREYVDESTCAVKFLQVTYVDCLSKKSVTEFFCHTRTVNEKRKSCGDVTISSYSYLKGEDRGNRFLLSYSVNSHETDASYIPYIHTCGTTPQSVSNENKTKLHSKNLNITYEDVMFNPKRFTLILRIVMINFLLLILAFILTITIFITCHKYRELNRKGEYKFTAQKKDNIREAGTQDKNKRNDELYNEVGPATSSTAPEQSRTKRHKDPYASYDSLDFTPQTETTAMTFNTRCSAMSVNSDPHSPTGGSDPPDRIPHDQHVFRNGTPSNQDVIIGENGVPHVKVNNDYYAVVQKFREHVEAKEPLLRKTRDSNNSQTHESGATRDPFSSDAGFLPQHHCKLTHSLDIDHNSHHK